MLRIVFIFLFVCWTQLLHADERAQTQRQIQQVKKDIAELQRLIKKNQGEKSIALQNLKNTEQKIGKLEVKTRELEKQLKKNEQQINTLQKEEKDLQSLRIQQQELISIQGRAAYQAGQHEPLRLLLNQQQPSLVSHNLTYYQYMHQARSAQINTYNQTIARLIQIQQNVRRQQQATEQQKQALAEQKDQLAKLKKERQQRVNQLDKQHSSHQQQLNAREQDRKALSELMATIEAELARQEQAERLRREQAQALLIQQHQAQNATSDSSKQILVSSDFIHPGGNFEKAKGSLPWPISGRMTARFGSPRGDSRSLWDGVLIQSVEGTQVRAIHAGRVVFSDWLRGSGLLVIIDHGNGYLSLYGHNQTLHSSAGDTVKAGQVIATVGNTGGQANSALYFAIRKNGKATDPSQWCRT